MYTYVESPGERAIKAELRHLKIRFYQEKKITGLRGDTKSYRIADFYLPQYDAYIEFLGGWNSGEDEQRRYKHKMAVYRKNGIECLYIFPNQLHYTPNVIKKYLNRLNNQKETHPAEEKTKQQVQKHHRKDIYREVLKEKVKDMWDKEDQKRKEQEKKKRFNFFKDTWLGENIKEATGWAVHNVIYTILVTILYITYYSAIIGVFFSIVWTLIEYNQASIYLGATSLAFFLALKYIRDKKYIDRFT